jgi:hypothetical protein
VCAASCERHTPPVTGLEPGNLSAGTGVNRSLPIEAWCSRNSRVTTAQMV